MVEMRFGGSIDNSEAGLNTSCSGTMKNIFLWPEDKSNLTLLNGQTYTIPAEQCTSRLILKVDLYSGQLTTLCHFSHSCATHVCHVAHHCENCEASKDRGATVDGRHDYWIHEAIVVKLIVGGKSNQSAPGCAQREKNLCCCQLPNLKAVDNIVGSAQPCFKNNSWTTA